MLGSHFSRPDICARLAGIASWLDQLCASDVFRINGLVRVAKDWQQATALKYASPPRPRETSGRGDRTKQAPRNQGVKVHRGSAPLVGRPDAAYSDQSTEGKRRLGYVVGLTSSTPRSPCRILQWTSKFTWEFVKSILGGEVYAPSEMADYMMLLRVFFGTFDGAIPDRVGLGGCENLFSRRQTEEMIAE